MQIIQTSQKRQKSKNWQMGSLSIFLHWVGSPLL